MGTSSEGSEQVMSKLTHVVQEFRSGVSLNVVRIEVTPSQLDVKPELVARRPIHYVLGLFPIY